MNTTLNVHIISHTHWDREWYLNSKYTNEWLIPFFDNLFSMLEKEEDYIFVLDGQMAMVEDYFEELDKAGFNRHVITRKIRKFVQRKQLFIGPYYLQPDWQLLSEESLVRNMLIGNQLLSDFGSTMQVGWLLDNFGQISQTSQIHKEAGLRGLYVWRGVEMNPEEVQSEFLWESPDGTSLPAIYLLDSYRNVMRLAEYREIMQQRIFDEIEKLRPFATTRNILLMNGYDQEMIPDDIQPYIKNKKMDTDHIHVFQSNPEKFLEDVMAETPHLKTLKGALYSGRFIAVFPGVMSARMYLKLQNDAQQKALEKRAEPLSAIAWSLGGEYNRQLITEAWKTLLKNHPHDSICGVSIDDVHTDMEERTRYVNQLTNAQIQQKLRELTGLIDTSGVVDNEVKVVFNPSMYTRNEVVTYDNTSWYVKDIPAMGYKIIEKSAEPDCILKTEGHTVENSFIILSVNHNGSFNLLHKPTGKEYKNLGIIEDRADTGDEYNYSYPDTDRIITTSHTEADITVIQQSVIQVVMRIKLEMDLPESDSDNHTKRSTTLRKLPIVTYITVKADSPVVTCRTIIRNTVKDHVMRALFPSDIITDAAYAGSPFDITRRPIHIAPYDESTIPEHVKKVLVGAREAKPNTVFHHREFVDLHDENRGLAIFSRGLPEYQVIENHTIALTLFRSVGWVAKDINSRIGDAGPIIYTPGAQCLREMSFDYAVYPHQGNVFEGNVCRESDTFNTSLITLITDKHTGMLGPENSFFKVRDESCSFKVTSCKQGEDGNSIIIRGYNSSERSIDIEIDSFFTIKKANLVNLLELEEKEELLPIDNTIALAVAPKKIVTLKFYIDRMSLPVSTYSDIIIEEDKTHEDFTEYNYCPLVTEEDIENERLRAKKLKKHINDPMITRTALEAQLSTILTQNRMNESRIKELGYKLNEARVQRRVFDYIKQYKDPEANN